MQKIVIFGIGDFAELVYYYFSNDSNYEVVGFTVNRSFIYAETFLGLPLVPFEDIEQIYSNKQFKMFIAIGYSEMNKLRRNIFLQVKLKGYKFSSFISKDAIVAKNVELGDNCFIQEGVIVQPFVKIGNAVILWSGSHIGHHSIVKDFCFVAPCASLAGNVTINEGSFIGNSAVIRNGVQIGKECVVGAGVIILEDTIDKSVFKATSSIAMDISSDQLRRL